MFQITFQAATVTNCDFIGRTVSGVCAVVTKDGAEVFRSKPHAKRAPGKIEALNFLSQAEGTIQVFRVDGSLRTHTRNIPARSLREFSAGGEWVL